MKRFNFSLITILCLTVFLSACGTGETTPTLSAANMAFTKVQLTVDAALSQTPFIAATTQTATLVQDQTSEPTDLPVSEPTTADTKAQQFTPAPTVDQTAPCLQAGFVEDVTIPDGTEMLPGESFIKTWRLINLGSCPWSPDFRVVFNSGNAMGAEAALAFTAIEVPIGKVVDVSITMTAPESPGTHTGYWQLRSEDGEIFGTVPDDAAFYVEIVVLEITSTPTETMTPTITQTPTETSIPTDIPTPTLTETPSDG